MTSSDSSSDLDFQMDDVEEGAVVRVQASVQNLGNKIEIASDEVPSEIEEEEEDLNDWETDSKAPSIYKQPPSEKSEPVPKPKNKFYHLFDEPKKKKRAKVDVEGRFYKYKAEVNKKISELAKVLEAKETEECSFKPTILNKSKTRSVPEFLKSVQNFEKNRKEKIKSAKEQEEKEIVKITKRAHPKLCKNSAKIVAKNSEYDKEKLSKPKPPPKPIIDTNPYAPSVNPRSQDLFRPKSVDKLLYEDALRRHSKILKEEPTLAAKLISEKSEKCLLEKFKREFKEMFSYLDIENSNSLNYTKFTELLYNMSFLSRLSSKHNEQKQLAIKIWTMLGGVEKGFVDYCNLQSFLVSMMNYKDPSTPAHTEAPNLGRLINNIYCISPPEVLKIHRSFYLLFEERNLSKPSALNTTIESASFTDSRRKSDTKHEDRLMLEKTRLQQKWDAIRQKKVVEEVSACTFQPKIKRGPRTIASSSDLNDSSISQYSFYSENKSQSQRRSEILFEYSKIFYQQKNINSKTKVDSKAADEVKHCTFRPKITKRIQVEEVPEANGVKKLINRLRNARKNKGNPATEKPFVFGMETNISRLSIDLNSSFGSNGSKYSKSISNRSFTSESESASLIVNLPNGKKSIFKLSPNDNKALLINKFIQRNSLKGEAEIKFRNSIKNLMI
jgi:hypothetical protein